MRPVDVATGSHHSKLAKKVEYYGHVIYDPSASTDLTLSIKRSNRSSSSVWAVESLLAWLGFRDSSLHKETKKSTRDDDLIYLSITTSNQSTAPTRSEENEDERVFDDRADDEEFLFALASKGMSTEGYYSVVSYENQKLEESP